MLDAETSRLSCREKDASVIGWLDGRRGVVSVERANPVFSVIASSPLVETVSWGCRDIVERGTLSDEIDLGRGFKDAGREGWTEAINEGGADGLLCRYST